MPRIGTIRPTRPADIEVRDLGKRYGRAGSGIFAMDDVDLTVPAGEFVCVVGASGCGKSTLLRILAGFEPATKGTVTVAGEAVSKPDPERGVVFQDYGLFPWLSVSENIAYGPRQARLPRDVVRERTTRFLEAVGLTRFAAKFPHELSGGMQQRVAIARVLANDPSVMLMDEPFGALDALTRSSLQAELSKIHRETGTTVVFVTHSIEEAVFLADRVVVMAGGASHGVPGHIREIVPIGLGADRDVTSPEFNELKRHISALVHQGVEVAA
ncbi:ABC-type nitrate/sulfonate/bicarbonate transport system, ATPase component [Sanguibacter keddieii DSM 10542]|jgi:ABC-type nitrate/sulfonate/bicarbonate transport system ATPase subunit|uniref:ABC-type quaternary amine transporter n=1 Tax=Sanguibacter keddieii (strain ATCC 51767 / DSM 10542 / NCFB 3025 / ST-74) TaxID=446469 RepID=D1BGP2_SANKS|nr:ABC transporter ATP-binding protein [Sanguibacter keddieii]ACZ21619.1 ABC-type nitrate/sulfonate/bicarbonate transport system, ATPase component [Sanguibacter keddieii DSM 10542]